MKDLFITKSTIDYGLSTATGDIAGTWEIDLLTTGSLCIVDGDGTFVDDTTPVITTNTFGILLGTTEGVKVLESLDRETLTYEKNIYSAAVKAVKYLGSDTNTGAGSYSLNLPSSITVGDTVGCTITDLTKPVYDTSREKHYSFDVISGDLLTGVTSRNIITKLVTLINADANAVVVATAYTGAGGTNNDGIYFIAKTAGEDFAISHLGSNQITDVLGDAQIVEYLRVDGVYTAGSTNAVASRPAQGDATWLSALETDVTSRDGNINSYIMPNQMWKITSKVVSSDTYTVYTLTTRKHDDSVLIREENPIITIYIAVPSGDTGAGEHIFALDNILAVL